MECRLQSAPSWSCDIILRFHFDASGVPLAEPKDYKFGDTIFDPNQVEDKLRRAQSAILNPGVDHACFLQETIQDVGSLKDGLSFSYNVVCLRVSGPNVPDLYFYDLPGNLMT